MQCRWMQRGTGLLLVFLTWGLPLRVSAAVLSQSQTAVDGTQHQAAINDSLIWDLNQLKAFSTQLTQYGLTPLQFQDLFWKGLYSAVAFYESPEPFQAEEVYRLLQVNLPQRLTGLPHFQPATTKTQAAFQALNAFSGTWHGQWRHFQFAHLWLSVRSAGWSFASNAVLVGYQSCFTGDGIGWNYVVELADEIVILGYVCHFNAQGQLYAENPHYAYVNQQLQLTWVSDDHVYFECVETAPLPDSARHYRITGGQYLKRSRKTKLVNGFQAHYVRQEQPLPAFTELPVASAWQFWNRSWIHRLSDIEWLDGLLDW